MVDYAAARGVDVTPRQLKRWRTLRLIPSRQVRGLGRGRGVIGIDPAWTKFQVLAVRKALSANRNVEDALLTLWYDGWDVPAEVIARSLGGWLLVKQAALARLSKEVAARASMDKRDVTPFDIAEADSRASTVTRAEQDRMSRAVHRDERELPRDLVHAVRAAAEGQVLSAVDEVSAIPIELAKHYFGFEKYQTLFRTLGATDDEAVSEWETMLGSIDPARLFDPPTTTQLVSARWRLRYIFEVADHLRTYEPSPDEAVFVDVFRESLGADLLGWDTRSPSFDIEGLRNLLVFPSHLQKQVKYSF